MSDSLLYTSVMVASFSPAKIYTCPPVRFPQLPLSQILESIIQDCLLYVIHFNLTALECSEWETPWRVLDYVRQWIRWLSPSADHNNRRHYFLHIGFPRQQHHSGAIYHRAAVLTTK
jgi:hypothetical protein